MANRCLCLLGHPTLDQPGIPPAYARDNLRAACPEHGLRCYRCKEWPCVCRDGITVIHGDCRDVLPLLEPGSVDLVLTDPPYGVGFQYTDAYDDARPDYDEWVIAIFEDMRRVGKMVMLTTGMRNLWLYPPADWVLCWAKPGSVRRSGIGGFNEWEPVLIYGKRRIYNDFWYLPDVNQHDPAADGHPCPKPVSLYTRLIQQGCDTDGLILDPFMGSGTTLRAAKDLGRKAIGVEIEEKYCQIAVKRLAQEVLL